MYDYITVRSLLGVINSFEFQAPLAALIVDIDAPYCSRDTTQFKLTPGAESKISAAANLLDNLSVCAQNLTDTLVYNDNARKQIVDGPEVVRNLINLASAGRSSSTANTKAWTAPNSKKEELESISEHAAPEDLVLLNASLMLVDYRAIVKMLDIFIRELKIDAPGNPAQQSAQKLLFWLLLAIATIATKSDTLAIQENLSKLSSVTKRMPGIECQIQILFAVFDGAVSNFYEGYAPKIWSKLFDEVRKTSAFIRKIPIKTEESMFTCIADLCIPNDEPRQ